MKDIIPKIPVIQETARVADEILKAVSQGI